MLQILSQRQQETEQSHHGTQALSTGNTELINVNTASASELERLPGIGPKKAQAILQTRGEAPFASIDDLQRVRGIGPKTLERLRPLVTIGERAEEGKRP